MAKYKTEEKEKERRENSVDIGLTPPLLGPPKPLLILIPSNFPPKKRVSSCEGVKESQNSQIVFPPNKCYLCRCRRPVLRKGYYFFWLEFVRNDTCSVTQCRRTVILFFLFSFFFFVVCLTPWIFSSGCTFIFFSTFVF